jgi:DNA-binding LacI/PurR family transcriptional regulator
MYELNRKDYTPLYMQFYHLLKDMIAKAVPGTHLPPERVLCEQYRVDRVTVRKALAMLADERLIERRQGRGTRILGTSDNAAEPEGSILFALYHGTHLVDRIGEPFYARSMDMLERALHQKGERLVYSKVRREDNLAALCERLLVKGIILAGMPDEQLDAQCRALSVPIVAYNNRMNGMPCVLADNESGAATAASHLLSLGHRAIGYFHVPEYANSERRLKQFARTLRDAQFPEDCLHIVEGDWTELGGYFAMERILAEHPAVTAVFAGNDSMAIGALRALDKAGITVPKQMSVVGFDGIAQSTATKPPLTTFQVDISAMTEAACMMLFHILAGGSCEGMQTIVSAKLLLRGSTAER